MTRSDAIAKITATLTKLSDERVQTLAELAQSWTAESELPVEDEETRTAIAKGLAEGQSGQFATDEQVDKAFGRFRK